MKSWIRGEKYVITPTVVASAFGVPLVQQLVYPCTKTLHLGDIMSLIIGSSISWGIDPCVIFHEFTELNYLFFRISCHSIWPISHFRTILFKRCAFLYALFTDALMIFPTFFICSLVEVHRSSVKSHGLFFLVFIHRILLDLGLENFPAFESIHIIAHIGATFLSQRVAQLKASSKCFRVESSIGDALRPPLSGDLSTETYVDPTTIVDPPPSTSSDSSLRAMLDTIMTVQAAHG